MFDIKKKLEVLFGTSNKNKLREAEFIFNKTNITITHYPVDLVELQDWSLKTIAVYSLEQLPSQNKPIFVEDSGLFINGLNGFPGPYAAHVFKSIGNEGILKLMEDLKDRKAYFESCVAYKEISGHVHAFLGVCEGEISFEIRGKMWGYDPIFIPNDQELNPKSLTFSELGDEVKNNNLSHRAKALENLKSFLISNN